MFIKTVYKNIPTKAFREKNIIGSVPRRPQFKWFAINCFFVIKLLKLFSLFYSIALLFMSFLLKV